MIEIEHLRMEYGATVALENLSLSIGQGEVFGLIGPNGAGKTTLIRILATLLEPTYGRVRVGGVDALESPVEVHGKIAYMSDFFSLYDRMLVWEYLDHFARCYRVPAARRDRLIEEALELVSLKVRRGAEISELSRGMRQRLCFAKSLLHEPDVLLLDEPASGLDPAGRVEFRELMKQLREMGRTILISSHILTEMTAFCTSIGILEEGRLLASGRVDEILDQMQAGLCLKIETIGPPERLLEHVAAFEATDVPTFFNGVVECRWRGPRDQLPELHRRLVEAGVPVVSFAVIDDNLEDIYMRISGHHTS
ncbi:ABC transporter ATP-binding protein [Pirellulales bacterium]|nr:ABC transporter ATP-binding protein [Pirellulales bacterium]